MTSYPAPSPQFVEARWMGGRQTPRLVVMHSTVSPCAIGGALNIARMFALMDRVASAHYVVDPADTIQCVPDHRVAFHCGYNDDSIGVEMCEYPSWTNLARWSTRPHRRMRRRAVDLVAQLCLAYAIPPHYVGPRALLAGRHGITTHRAMSRAFKRSTHWDPGAWPRRAFMRAVRRRIDELKAAA
jgi:N-acetylmuramoyl-L-alanine amidase CwlA